MSFGLQKENMYGHKKRCEFILSTIKMYYRENQEKKIRILDVGCGTGEMITLPIAEAGHDITGIDIDLNSINRARNMNIFKNATFLCENLEGFIPTEKYDVIICSEVLEHLENPQKVLSSIRKLMKKDGIMIITIPNGFGPFEIEKFIFDKTGLIRGLLWVMKRVKNAISSIFGIMQKPDKKKEKGVHMTENVECEHIQFFTMRKFRQMIELCGLKIERMSKSSFLAGAVTGFIFGKSPKFIDWNVNRVVTVLPYFLCSGWYFVIKIDKEQ